jgi:hypothetical protein
MSLTEFPEELILLISDYIYSNIDMVRLRICCRYFKEIGDKWGYIKHIKFGWDTDMMNFVHLNGFHSKFIQILEMDRINNPIPWIPCRWPKHVIFNECVMRTKLINPPLSNTENLTIKQPYFCKNKLKINWSKIPNLKHLNIHSYDMEFEGLDKCKNIKTICIDLHNNSEIPDWICNFPKLEILISSCLCKKPLHFISNNFKICLIPKMKKFTSNSKFIPELHLNANPNEYINVSSF